MITLRRVVEADFALLSTWLAQPHVHRWWHHDFSAAGVEADFGPTARGEEPAEDLLAIEDDAPFGLVQRSRWDDYPDERDALASWVELPPEAVTIDYLIGDPARVGRGLGTRLIVAAAADTWHAYPAAPCIVVPVVMANTASWRALERAGFAHVGEAELEPDNPVDPRLHRVQRLNRPTSLI